MISLRGTLPASRPTGFQHCILQMVEEAATNPEFDPYTTYFSLPAIYYFSTGPAHNTNHSSILNPGSMSMSSYAFNLLARFVSDAGSAVGLCSCTSRHAYRIATPQFMQCIELPACPTRAVRDLGNTLSSFAKLHKLTPCVYSFFVGKAWANKASPARSQRS